MTAAEERDRDRNLIDALTQLYLRRKTPAVRDIVAACIVAVVSEDDPAPGLLEFVGAELNSHYANPTDRSGREVADAVMSYSG